MHGSRKVGNHCFSRCNIIPGLNSVDTLVSTSKKLDAIVVLEVYWREVQNTRDGRRFAEW